MTLRVAARNLRAGYGALTVVHGIDLEVNAGEVVALLGPNGAGKTSTLLTLAGLLPSHGGSVTWGVGVGGRQTVPAHRRARHGVALVGEHAVFRQLSVKQNLRLGQAQPQRALRIFPELTPLLARRAGLLSGGEQQMVAMGRALAADPKVLLLDEVSMGLAPVVVDRLMKTVVRAAAEGAAVLLVEQQARRALSVAQRGYFMSHGRITRSGSTAELTDFLSAGHDAYFGSAASTPSSPGDD